MKFYKVSYVDLNGKFYSTTVNEKELEYIRSNYIVVEAVEIKE